MAIKERLCRRNEAVRSYAEKLENQYPHWKMEYILSKCAERFYLSKRTIEAIIKAEGIYSS